MIDNPYTPPKSTRDAIAQLGPILMSCRDRSEKDRLVAMKQNMVVYYLMPLLVPIMALVLTVLGIDKLGIKLSVQGGRILFGSIYLFCCGGLYWQLFRTPKSHSLVLHELGLGTRPDCTSH